MRVDCQENSHQGSRRDSQHTVEGLLSARREGQSRDGADTEQLISTLETELSRERAMNDLLQSLLTEGQKKWQAGNASALVEQAEERCRAAEQAVADTREQQIRSAAEVPELPC